MVISPDLERILKKIEEPLTDAKNENKTRFMNANETTSEDKKLVREDYIDVILFDTEAETQSDRLASWKISSVDSQSIVIDLEINRPLSVSQGDVPD